MLVIVWDMNHVTLVITNWIKNNVFLLQLRDEDLSKEMQESNWFSAPSALRVYGQYLNLDKDHNGMLSKDELARWVLDT